MNAEHNKKRCTCQLCVPNWQFVDGAFEPMLDSAESTEEAKRHETGLQRLLQKRLREQVPQLNLVG